MSKTKTNEIEIALGNYYGMVTVQQIEPSGNCYIWLTDWDGEVCKKKISEQLFTLLLKELPTKL